MQEIKYKNKKVKGCHWIYRYTRCPIGQGRVRWSRASQRNFGEIFMVSSPDCKRCEYYAGSSPKRKIVFCKADKEKKG